MGLFKKQVSPPEEEPKRDHSTSSEGSGGHSEAKVTVLACTLGAVASIGGFIFGYVR
jgi:SP family sugar:H+ symporter-like MFS transporter